METLRLISTPKKVRLLTVILRTPHAKLRVRELAKLAKVSPGLVSQYLKLLKNGHMLREGSLVLDSPRLRSLKSFLNIEQLASAQVTKIILKEMPGAKGIGVYGSWLSGTNDERSDLDLWVKVQKRPAPTAPARASRLCREALGTTTEISINLLTGENLNDMKSRNDPFYFSLFNSFVLWGESID